MWPWSEIRLLRSALRFYAGDQVLSRVLSSGYKALELGGETVELTIMFVEMRLSSIPENATWPTELRGNLQCCFQIITESVLAHRGLVDSYMGDTCVAWWDDATQACTCAKNIVERVAQINSASDTKDIPQIKLGIGINTGPVSLGNYGSPQRMQYSVLGNNVNLASNLCRMAAREYHFPIVISESTKQKIPETFQPTTLESVQVKGRDGHIGIFSL